MYNKRGCSWLSSLEQQTDIFVIDQIDESPVNFKSTRPTNDSRQFIC